MRTISPAAIGNNGSTVLKVVESAIVRHAETLADGQVYLYVEADFNDGPLVERNVRVIASNMEIAKDEIWLASCDGPSGMRHVYLLPANDSGLDLSEQAEDAYRLLKGDGFFIDVDSRQFGPGENDIEVERTAEQTIAIAELELAGFVYHDPAE